MLPLDWLHLGISCEFLSRKWPLFPHIWANKKRKKWLPRCCPQPTKCSELPHHQKTIETCIHLFVGFLLATFDQPWNRGQPIYHSFMLLNEMAMFAGLICYLFLINHVYIYTLYTYMYVYLCICMYIYVYVYVCMYIYIFIYYLEFIQLCTSVGNHCEWVNSLTEAYMKIYIYTYIHT